jgi:cyclopropane-fatty-acyl-phospholipid synthase
MFDRLALHLFKQFVSFGTLSVTIGSGAVYRMTANRPGPKVAIKLANSQTLWRIVMKPDLVIGEAYMDGLLRIENDDLESFVELLMLNSRHWAEHWAGRLSLFLNRRLAFLSHWNKPRASRRNVAHHYDLTDQLFDSFLDPRRQYSCAYFEAADTPLDVAQNTKIARLAAKLSLRHGDAVLDIGCGWGGLATALCTCRENVHVTGITLSAGQLAYATKKAQADGLEHRLNFAHRDYRKQKGKFDKIVSVGMLEHVGPTNFKTYFRQIKRLLRQNGIAVVHSIGVHGRADPVNRWLTKYIFPGGFLPSLDQMIAATEHQGLKIIDLEIMRGHYAETLRHWRANFHANITEIRKVYDERFVRMWDFYLLGCEYFFRTQRGMVFQLQLAHDQMAVPINRQYMCKLEAEFKEILCRKSHSGNESHLQK